MTRALLIILLCHYCIHLCLTADIAICLTGQLLRLELGSKIENLVKTNIDHGHNVSLFILLDGDHKSKAVKIANRFDVDTSIYYAFNNNHSSITGSKLLEDIIYGAVLYKKPTRAKAFSVKVRITMGPKHKYLSKFEQKEEYDRERFQCHMRWLMGLRDCHEWMENFELKIKKKKFHFVMRLRDDTFVYQPFVFNTAKYKGKFVSTKFNSWGGLNDHNLIADRSISNVMFRRMVEEYYTSKNSVILKWQKNDDSPEKYFKSQARQNGVNIYLEDVCSYPFIPIFSAGRNGHQWQLHVRYIPSCPKIDKVKKFHGLVEMFSFDKSVKYFVHVKGFKRRRLTA